ncbi:hypothetical protein [Acinetobacter sp.]|uniref:hypothetical protein n=1 Tax=Acinetobacter sp. TaxID=472 RepID=UPI0038903A71
MKRLEELKEGYDPNRLLNHLLDVNFLKNDAALCALLEVTPPRICKIRHHRLPIGASMLIRIHEVNGLTFKEMREILGDRRQKYRVSSSAGKPVIAQGV